MKLCPEPNVRTCSVMAVKICVDVSAAVQAAGAGVPVCKPAAVKYTTPCVEVAAS